MRSRIAQFRSRATHPPGEPAVTPPRVNLYIDSDNNAGIDNTWPVYGPVGEVEDPIETGSPGKIIALADATADPDGTGFWMVLSDTQSTDTVTFDISGGGGDWVQIGVLDLNLTPFTRPPFAYNPSPHEEKLCPTDIFSMSFPMALRCLWSRCRQCSPAR
jgi:hypothetical protein